MSDLDNILDDALADFEKDAEENSKESTWESSVDLSKPPLDFNDFTQVRKVDFNDFTHVVCSLSYLTYLRD